MIFGERRPTGRIMYRAPAVVEHSVAVDAEGIIDRRPVGFNGGECRVPPGGEGSGHPVDDRLEIFQL